MVVISEETCGGVHTHLPDLPLFPASMAEIKRRGGPWECHACGGPSYWSARCTRCGADLVDRN